MESLLGSTPGACLLFKRSPAAVGGDTTGFADEGSVPLYSIFCQQPTHSASMAKDTTAGEYSETIL